MRHTLTRRRVVLAGSIAVASALIGTTPAYAAPWAGGEVDFGPGRWELYSSSFIIEDVYLLFPDTSSEYTDIWDGAGETQIVSSQLSLDEYVSCASDSDVDISTDAGTGDLVITCAAANTNAAFAAAGLAVASEIRILAGGEVVRFTTTVTNTTTEEVVIDAVNVATNFGSDGELWDYENQSDAVLVVPAPESSPLEDDLNSVGARWIVHSETDDAPGGIIIGGGSPSVAAQWLLADGDEYAATVANFSIPAGASRSVVTFNTWHPQSLIDGDYTNSESPSVAVSAAQIVTGMSEFATLSGRLAAGLDPAVSVINWAPVIDEEPEPELAETGPADVLAAGALALLALAAGGVLVARRRAVV